MAQLANLTGKRIYLDTNIIIYSVEPANLSDQLYATVQAILNLANTDQIVLATSEFTLAEVLVRPFAANNQNLVDIYLRLILVNGPFLLQSMTRQVMIAAANIRA